MLKLKIAVERAMIEEKREGEGGREGARTISSERENLRVENREPVTWESVPIEFES